jgi:hypothetical protein
VAVKAELWRNGRFVTHCFVREDAYGASFIEGTVQQVPDGDYEIRNGNTVEKVTLKSGNWSPRPNPRRG